MYKLYLLFFIYFFTSNLFADSLQSRVDRENIEMGDIITLVVQTDFQTLTSPDFSNLHDQFSVLGKDQSSQITMVNGHFESYTRWDIRLAPKQMGELIIPPFKLGNVVSNPIKITVKPPSQNQNTYGVSFFEATVNQTQAYVQQEIIYTLRFYHLGDLTRGNTRPPIFQDAISKQLTKQTNYQKNVNGTHYEVYEWRWAIYPQKSGELKIEPQVFNGQLRYRGRMKRVSDKSQTIKLDIKPIPDSYPKHATWLPAMSIKLSEDWQYDKKISVGDSITRTLQIQADNLLASQLPELKIADQTGFHTYPDKANLENKTSRNGLTSQTTRKIAIIPVNQGDLTLPSYRLHWWNTKTNQLEISSLPEKTLPILPALNQKTTETITNPENTKTENKNKQLEQEEKNPRVVVAGDNIILWQLVSLLFAIAWLVTLFLWWLQRKKPEQVITKSESKDITRQGELPFCQTTDAKTYYQQLNQWLKQQTNEEQIRLEIEQNLSQLKGHLFNNQALEPDCLAKICESIKELQTIEQQQMPVNDKLEKLYL